MAASCYRCNKWQIFRSCAKCGNRFETVNPFIADCKRGKDDAEVTEETEGIEGNEIMNRNESEGKRKGWRWMREVR